MTPWHAMSQSVDGIESRDFLMAGFGPGESRIARVIRPRGRLRRALEKPKLAETRSHEDVALRVERAGPICRLTLAGPDWKDKTPALGIVLHGRPARGTEPGGRGAPARSPHGRPMGSRDHSDAVIDVDDTCCPPRQPECVRQGKWAKSDW